MKKIFPVFVVLFLVIFGCSRKGDSVKLEKGSAAYQLAQSISTRFPILNPDKNAVLISGKNIKVTAGDVMQSIQGQFGGRAVQLNDMDEDRVREIIKNIAERVADNKLLLNEAKKEKIAPTQAEVDSILNIQYKRSGGEKNFIDVANKNGLTIEAIKKDLRENLAIFHYLDKALAAGAQVSDDEVQKAYLEDKTATVRHILMMTTGKNDSAKIVVHQRMEEVLARAKRGEDFAGLAKTYSEDPGSKKNGGLYQDFARGAMVKPFEDAAFSLPVGSISGIIETPYGYHILRIIDRKKETQPLEEVRQKLTEQIVQKKKNAAFAALIDRLKMQAELKMVTI